MQEIGGERIPYWPDVPGGTVADVTGGGARHGGCGSCHRVRLSSQFAPRRGGGPSVVGSFSIVFYTPKRKCLGSFWGTLIETPAALPQGFFVLKRRFDR